MPVSQSVGHAAYRILQEAITNVLRHGDGRATEIGLQVSGPVRIRVSNPCPGGAGGEPGNGIRGTRERAARVGGTVHAGSDGAGAWVLQAELPVGESR